MVVGIYSGAIRAINKLALDYAFLHNEKSSCYLPFAQTAEIFFQKRISG
jgi:hypothetical protein